MTTNRDQRRTWLRAVMRHARIDKPTHLARKIGKAPSTINRFLNDENYEGDLSTSTLEKIAELTGVPVGVMPDMLKGKAAKQGSEAVQLESAESSPMVDRTVSKLIEMRGNLQAWLLQSMALQSAGYLPGDILLVDTEERPRARDVVCAQLYELRNGRVETVFRIYEPPYLIAASPDFELMRPYVVDDETVAIMGVVVGSMRNRRSRLQLAA